MTICAKDKSQEKEHVLKMARENNVKFIRFWFTDILGFLKSFAITLNELEGALEEGMGFDGSSIEGFARIDESDMVAMPDPSTFQILPWRNEGLKTARMICDVVQPDGTPYACDPRYVLKRNIEKASKLGYTYYVGPELEFFVFKDDEKKAIPLDKGGYFDLTHLDIGSNLRREMVLTLEEMGIQVEYSHHEVGWSQHEIDLRYSDALSMADNSMTYRLIVKEIARKNGVHATFMPKPIQGINGSGMHVHQSLFTGNSNAFYDANDPFHLSKLGRSYAAGVLKHAPEFTAVTNQWINSYKRLVPGYEAPVYLAWARRNRSALLRVPMYKPGKENATRFELRSPDPSCNPYLAFSVMLAAGLKGIEEGYELPDPVEQDIFEMSCKERENCGIENLPGTLMEAITAMENSTLVKEALGEELFYKFLDNKRIEWGKFCQHVTEFELDNYYDIL